MTQNYRLPFSAIVLLYYIITSLIIYGSAERGLTEIKSQTADLSFPSNPLLTQTLIALCDDSDEELQKGSINIELGGNPLLVMDVEIEILTNAFISTYEEISREACEGGFRRILEIDFDTSVLRQAQPSTGTFVFPAQITGFCGGCSDNVNFFGDNKIRRNNQIINPCLCPPPQDEDLRSRLNRIIEILQQRMALRNINNVISLTEIIDDVQPTVVQSPSIPPASAPNAQPVIVNRPPVFPFFDIGTKTTTSSEESSSPPIEDMIPAFTDQDLGNLQQKILFDPPQQIENEELYEELTACVFGIYKNVIDNHTGRYEYTVVSLSSWDNILLGSHEAMLIPSEEPVVLESTKIYNDWELLWDPALLELDDAVEQCIATVPVSVARVDGIITGKLGSVETVGLVMSFAYSKIEHFVFVPVSCPGDFSTFAMHRRLSMKTLTGAKDVAHLDGTITPYDELIYNSSNTHRLLMSQEIDMDLSCPILDTFADLNPESNNVPQNMRYEMEVCAFDVVEAYQNSTAILQTTNQNRLGQLKTRMDEELAELLNERTSTVRLAFQSCMCSVQPSNFTECLQKEFLNIVAIESNKRVRMDKAYDHANQNIASRLENELSNACTSALESVVQCIGVDKVPCSVVPSTSSMCCNDTDCISDADISFGILKCFQNRCLHEGNPRFTLTWNGQVTFELAVITPTGEIIFEGNKEDDITGGIFDAFYYDHNGKQMQSISFPSSKNEGLEGSYTYYVRNPDQNAKQSEQPLVWTLDVFINGKAVTSHSGSADSDVFKLDFSSSNVDVNSAIDNNGLDQCTIESESIECCNNSDCNGNHDSSVLHSCVANKCIVEGHPRFMLSWDGSDDYELVVISPVGDMIYRGNPSDNLSGGVAFEMNGISPFAAASHGTSISFPLPSGGPKGIYTYYVKFIDTGDEINNVVPSGRWSLEVFVDGILITSRSGVGDSDPFIYRHELTSMDDPIIEDQTVNIQGCSLDSPMTECCVDLDCESINTSLSLSLSSHGSICLNNRCIDDGNPRFTLTWTGNDEYDIVVIPPTGGMVYQANPIDDLSGGIFLENSQYVGAVRHAESIAFPQSGGGPSGIYTYYVRILQSSKSNNSDDNDMWILEVFVDGEVLVSRSGSGESSSYTLGFDPALGDLNDLELIDGPNAPENGDVDLCVGGCNDACTVNLPSIECCSDLDCSIDPVTLNSDVCVGGKCIPEGNPRFTLTWTGDADNFDITVMPPTGGILFWGNVADDVSGGRFTSDSGNHSDGPHVQSISFPTLSGGPSGTYSFYIDMSDELNTDETNVNSVTWLLEVFVDSQVVLSQSGTGGSNTFNFEYGTSSQPLLPTPRLPCIEGTGQCCTDDDCYNDEICYGQSCINDGFLRFSLSWHGDDDLDLFVVTPSGVIISYENTFDRNSSGRYGELPDQIATGLHTENIYFAEIPPDGNYQYYVVPMTIRDTSTGVGDAWTVEVFANGNKITTRKGRDRSSRFSYFSRMSQTLDIASHIDGHTTPSSSDVDVSPDEETSSPSVSILPSTSPSFTPTSMPSHEPSSVPSTIPSSQPSTAPSSDPSTAPSSSPSQLPSLSPTGGPTQPPSPSPSFAPSTFPSSGPSPGPSPSPSTMPSPLPSEIPSPLPSEIPSPSPSTNPSSSPSEIPSAIPSPSPTNAPTTPLPTNLPSFLPSSSPSSAPSSTPPNVPTMIVPTNIPSMSPTNALSELPSFSPTLTLPPTPSPTEELSPQPSPAPSDIPTATAMPTCLDDNSECCVDEDCMEPNDICFLGNCIPDGILRFTLYWEGDDDLDLYLETPSGELIFFGNPEASGGIYSENTNQSGQGTNIENIYFPNTPPNGDYRFFVIPFNERSPPDDWTIGVFVNGEEVQSTTGTGASPTLEFTFP